jgi:hypothetical protein
MHIIDHPGWLPGKPTLLHPIVFMLILMLHTVESN